ncbi:MAG: 50S ribosomal protein L4 [Deltaproteobacteria bacterium]|nr:50S ribosomal protein L4 [Deltaproteobacteria bacterium]
MPKVSVYNLNSEKVSEVDLADNIFSVAVNPGVVHQVVTMQLANRRSGTACTKDRSEVRGGGKKPWRQKGTGRARSGTSRSPLWRGGGVTFGPKPRDFSVKVNKKVRRLALKMVLSDKLSNDALMVLDDIQLTEPKTKLFAQVMKNLSFDSVLIINDLENTNLERSSRNLHRVKVLKTDGLNVYDVLKYKKIVLLLPSIEKIEKRLSS